MLLRRKMPLQRLLRCANRWTESCHMSDVEHSIKCTAATTTMTYPLQARAAVEWGEIRAWEESSPLKGTRLSHSQLMRMKWIIHSGLSMPTRLTRVLLMKTLPRSWRACKFKAARQAAIQRCIWTDKGACSALTVREERDMSACASKVSNLL